MFLHKVDKFYYPFRKITAIRIKYKWECCVLVGEGNRVRVIKNWR